MAVLRSLCCTLLLWMFASLAWADYPGRIDLREWSPGSQAMRELGGSWLLTWRDGVRPPQRTELPFIWRDGTPQWFGEVGFGQIELSTELLLPVSDEPLELYFDDLKSAARIWFNGELVASRGMPGDAEHEQPHIEPFLVPLPADETSVLIRIQLSNHFHREGGVDMPIMIGTRQHMEQRVVIARGTHLFALGGCILMALNLLLIGRWKDPQMLSGPFSLMLLLAAISAASTSGVLSSLLQLPVGLIYHIKYICPVLYPMIYAVLLRRLFPYETSALVTRILIVLGAGFSLLVLVTPPALFTQARDATAVVMVLASMFFLYNILQAVAQRREGARSILLGMLLVTFTVCNDALLYTRGLVTFSLFPLGVLALLLSHSVVLGQRMLTALRHNVELSDRLQRMNASLEQRVVDRTAVLQQNRDLLDNTLVHIQAAVLSLDGNGQITSLNQRLLELFGLAQRPRSFNELQQSLTLSRLGFSMAESRALVPAPWHAVERRESLRLENGQIIEVRRRGLADLGWVATYEDVTTRHLAETDTQGGEVGHWRLEMDQRGLSGSEACWRMLGHLQRPSVDAFPVAGLFHEEDRPLLHAALRQGRRAGEMQVTVRMRREDGGWLWVSLRARRICDHTGKTQFWVGVMENVDREIWTLHALEDAHDKAVRDAQQTTELLATLSHELRTPLVAVLGHLTLLMDEVDALPLQQRLRTVIDACGGLSGLMDGLLLAGRAGEASREQVSFDLHALLCESVELMRPQARYKGLSVDLYYPEHDAGWVHGSPASMRQILYNLIGNAIKFTERGGIGIHLRYGPEGLSLSVSDTGPGILSERQKEIFSAFSRQEQHRDLPGIGLGLFIVQRIVEQMQGSIDVQSQIGFGTVFRVTLPWRLTQAVVATHPSGMSLEGVYVLLVEDVAVNREVLRELLVRWGCTVDTAVDGYSAVAQCRQHDYDIVLMDIRLPDIDGLQASRLIRELDTQGDPLLVALTANAADLDIKECLSAGLDGVLAKPLQQEQLLAVLAGADTFSALGGQPDGELSGLRIEQLRQWLGESLFEQHLPQLLAALGEIRSQLAALREEDVLPLERLDATAHRLRGSAANFGLVQLERQARQVASKEDVSALLDMLDRHLATLHGWLKGGSAIVRAEIG